MSDPAAAAAPLPRGRHRLSRAEVWDSQRGRMLDAMAESVAERGYAGATITDVVTRAGVSKTTFYEHFGDKETCYLAAYELAITVLLEEMAEATEAYEDEGEKFRAAGRALLALVADEPAYARAFLVEVLGSFPAAVDRRAEVLRTFARFWENLYRRAHGVGEVCEAPSELAVALVAAAMELVATRVYEGRVASVRELEPVLEMLTTRILGPWPGELSAGAGAAG